ncbi:MAG: hypothetical protein PHW52_00490 [Candidatus Pacebacteria bacterium]|nr:hypothetical protein [Candidatus Paceibacterota bacterium]
MMRDILKIEKALKDLARQRKLVTLGRFFKIVHLRRNDSNEKEMILVLSLINDNLYQKYDIVICSLILKDDKYAPIDMFIDYMIEEEKMKEEESIGIFWIIEIEKCFAYYDKI